MHTAVRRVLLGVLALFAGFGAASTADAKLDSKAWKAAHTEFERLFQERGSGAEKIAVLKTVVSDGTARAYKLVLQGFSQQVERTLAVRTDYAKAAGVHGDILLASIKGYTPTAELKAKELQKRLKDLEEVLAAETQVMDAMLSTLAAAPAGARKNILKLFKAKSPWSLRAEVLQLAGMSVGDKASFKVLKKYLPDEPDARVRIAALDGLLMAKDLPKTARPLVVARLADTDGRAVGLAASIIAKHPCPEAIEPVQGAWAAAGARNRIALRAAIEAVLADAASAAKSAKLKTWWDAQEKAPPPSRVATIPLATDGVLFLVDVSTYMKKETKEGAWKPAPTDGSKPSTGMAGQRVGLAAHELQMALRGLPETAHFNIMAFNHGALLWERSMRPATDVNKDLAKRWMRDLKASGSCYVDGAMRLAFRLAGTFDTSDEFEAPEIDTLVVISAGTTTDNSFPTHRPVKPAEVLGRIAQWNAKPGLVIHAACFGESDFLRDLAAAHGGRYVYR